MKISIAMATYNGSRYLPEQLDSFLRQSRQPDELVVCDDCSRDGTIAILTDFQKRAPFPVFISRNEKNLGFIKNFEQALSLCTGDIIFLSDQDDVWLENKLETIEKTFLAHPEKMIVTNDQRIASQDLQSSTGTTLENIRALGLEKAYMKAGCCTAIRKSWLEVVLPIPVEIGTHDAWINRIGDFCQLRLIVEQPLQIYRRHEENTSHSLTSSAGKLSRLSKLTHYGIRDASGGWKHQIIATNLYIGRLEKRARQLKALGAGELVEQTIAALQGKLPALEKRLEIASRPRWRRPPELLRFWLSGGYRNFAGWKSALKDMVRP